MKPRSRKMKAISFAFGILHFATWCGVMLWTLEWMNRNMPDALAMLLPLIFAGFVIAVFVSRALIIRIIHRAKP